ncbi:Large ribosomal subunit protein P2B-like protein [Drosera capensis]
MKVIAAYLLAVLGGNTSPSSDDIKDILGSVGAEADDDRIDLLLSEVKGKDITELIAAGREKLASVPAGGGGGVAVSAAPLAGGGGGAAAPADEPKKEEKVEEKEESDDVRILFPSSPFFRLFVLTWDSVSLTKEAKVLQQCFFFFGFRLSF